MEGYAWLLTWWLLLALQMTYGKWMTEKIEMTQWERVFYTNAFAIPPTIALYYGTGESAKVAAPGGVALGEYAYTWLVASCAIARTHTTMLVRTPSACASARRSLKRSP